MSFAISDMVGLTELRHNLSDVVDEIANGGPEKVVIKNNKAAVVIESAARYEEREERLALLEDRLIALELPEMYRQSVEEGKRGELIDLDDLAAEFGFKESDFDLKAMRNEG
jgi:prevent-host-death family protein